MNVAPTLTVICFVLLMGLGLFTVVFSLLRMAQNTLAGKTSNLKIPWFGGKTIEIKGPAWLLVTAIGVLMVGSPVLAAFAQKPHDVTEPPITVQRVQQDERLPDENQHDFIFENDLSIVDLRQSQNTSWSSTIRRIFDKHEDDKIRPTVVRNVMTIRKTKPVESLVMSYSSTGKLVVHCLSSQATYKEKVVTESGKTTDTWSLNVDVSAMPLDKDFQVVVEATYYDAFSGESGSDYSTYANQQDPIHPEDVSILLIFPEDKPMKSIDVGEFPPNGGPGNTFSGDSRKWQDPNNRSYFWVTNNTRPDYFYKLSWTW